jgi:hypothetical protein
MKVTFVVWTAAVTVLVASVSLLLTSKQASASAQFSQQTGKACNFCHTAPPALNDQGKSFKAKGNKL